MPLTFLAPILGWVSKNKALTGLIAFMALVIALGSTYTLGSHNGRMAERTRNELATQRAITEAVKRNTAALEAAAAQRRIDDAKVASTKQGREDAVQALPDARPSDRGIVLTCLRLRDEGHNIAKLPECVRLGVPAKADH